MTPPHAGIKGCNGIDQISSVHIQTHCLYGIGIFKRILFNGLPHALSLMLARKKGIRRIIHPHDIHPIVFFQTCRLLSFYEQLLRIQEISR